MNPLTIKHTTFGDGVPKICIPITGRTENEILKAAEKISRLPADVAEWRADYYEAVTEPGAVLPVLAALRKRSSSSPSAQKKKAATAPSPTKLIWSFAGRRPEAASQTFWTWSFSPGQSRHKQKLTGRQEQTGRQSFPHRQKQACRRSRLRTAAAG